MYIPPGVGTVTPYFFVDDAPRFVASYGDRQVGVLRQPTVEYTSESSS